MKRNPTTLATLGTLLLALSVTLMVCPAWAHEAEPDREAAGITRQWDEVKGNPASFLERSYTSLTHRYAGH